MDSHLHKHYHDEEYDPRLCAETYFSETSVLAEDRQNIVRTLYKIFSSGKVTGKTLLDVTNGSSIYQFLPACESFQEIIVAESNERVKRDLEKWLNKEPDAFDYSHTSKLLCELEGKSFQIELFVPIRPGAKLGLFQMGDIREQPDVSEFFMFVTSQTDMELVIEEKEEQLRRTIKRILICDFTKENPLHPVILPKVDCLITVAYLEVVSKDLDAYRSNLKKVSSLIKVGGHLVLFVFISMTYYMIGEHKFYMLKYDEEFVRKALTDTGFVIKSVDLQARKKTTHLTDYEHIGFILAQKEREV
ncbi:indolethylamine N-methyltransferase-like [Ascaphus truei]|uniref:indolethylamine N-methyltransferase-like n=1 Tax=Ascaphus truei TaxID=8439 RepID=UPI003F5ACAE6